MIWPTVGSRCARSDGWLPLGGTTESIVPASQRRSLLARKYVIMGVNVVNNNAIENAVRNRNKGALVNWVMTHSVGRTPLKEDLSLFLVPAREVIAQGLARVPVACDSAGLKLVQRTYQNEGAAGRFDRRRQRTATCRRGLYCPLLRNEGTCAKPDLRRIQSLRSGG
jgi:hypothetical protein